MARITVKTPTMGKLFFALENSDKIIKTQWIDVTSEQTNLYIKITKNMANTSYANVLLVQPHGQTKNNRPLRMYGVMPLDVIDSDKKIKCLVKVPDTIRPFEEFDIGIDIPDTPEAQLTIAIVDEGLLSLTDYKTPDPFKFFTEKERLNNFTYDNFDNIIGADFGKIYKKFSIGGGIVVDKKEDNKKQLGTKAQRFKPVSMFKGPIKTDKNGHAKVTFKMPAYIGQVKVMIIATQKEKYGFFEKVYL